jgi:hypothetical protein
VHERLADIAFEKAGFKNAIVGKEAPTWADDSVHGVLEDVRYSGVIL